MDGWMDGLVVLHGTAGDGGGGGGRGGRKRRLVVVELGGNIKKRGSGEGKDDCGGGEVRGF